MRYAIRETFAGLSGNRTNAVAIVITLWVSLALFGIGLASSLQVERMKGDWYDKIELSIFLCVPDTSGPLCVEGKAATDEQRETIKAALTGHPQVEKVYYETKAEAFAGFQKAYAKSPVLPTVTEGMMQDSFRVKLVNPEQYKEVVAAVSALPGVQSVQDLRAVLEPLFTWLNVAKWGTIVASVLLLLAAAVQISTTIRIAAVSRERELSIMRFVGASNLTILLPFLMEAVWAALVGAVLACGTLAVGYKMAVIDKAAKILAGTPWLSWSDMGLVMAACFALGIVLSVIPTIFSTRRVLAV